MIHYYVLSAILEIMGCYYFYKGNYLLAIPALVLFAYTLGMQPYEPARAYVIYGGIYIVCSAVFALMTGVVLDARDWLGIGLMLAGVLILL
jgi:drug/metabolite transporter superfamily protein YnfA